MQRRSLMRVRRSSRIVTRLYDADRLLQNDRATIHQNMWLGECGFCIAALYAISPPSHFGNASLPHWSVQSHRPRLLTVGLNCARRKAFSSFAVFRGRDSFSRTRYPFTNIFDMYPPSMFILLHSRRAFEALWSNCSLSVAWIAHVEKASSRFFFFSRKILRALSPMFVNLFAEILSLRTIQPHLAHISYVNSGIYYIDNSLDETNTMCFSIVIHFVFFLIS